jgi:hypothetical protein
MAKPASLTVPTEPIGSIPTPVDLIERVARGDSEDPDFAPLYEDAIRDNIALFEATGSPVITDGEQRKHHDFATYCVHGLPNMASDGFQIPFSDGHTRRLPRLTRGVHTCPGNDFDSTHSADVGYAQLLPSLCVFSPFSDDTSTSRDTAFSKIRSRVLGTQLAARLIGAH